MPAIYSAFCSTCTALQTLASNMGSPERHCYHRADGAAEVSSLRLPCKRAAFCVRSMVQPLQQLYLHDEAPIATCLLLCDTSVSELVTMSNNHK